MEEHLEPTMKAGVTSKTTLFVCTNKTIVLIIFLAFLI
jgi:hypothetical protein